MHEGMSTDYLVDAMVFPGNSGGPVLSRPELAALHGTTSTHGSRVIGIVTGSLPYQEIAVSLQTRRPRVVFEDNSGLGSVLPMDVVNEVVQLERDRGLSMSS